MRVNFYLNRGKKIYFNLPLSNFEKKKRVKEREIKKEREDEARKSSIESFNRLIDSGIFEYKED
jgi:hypothetical protein